MGANFERWQLVIGSALALIASQAPINVFAAGVFLMPISEDLGFGRGEISMAIGISSIMTAVASPFIDRFGVRRPLALSIARHKEQT
jgi:MFS family permease